MERLTRYDANGIPCVGNESLCDEYDAKLNAIKRLTMEDALKGEQDG